MHNTQQYSGRNNTTHHTAVKKKLQRQQGRGSVLQNRSVALCVLRVAHIVDGVVSGRVLAAAHPALKQDTGPGRDHHCVTTVLRHWYSWRRGRSLKDVCGVPMPANLRRGARGGTATGTGGSFPHVMTMDAISVSGIAATTNGGSRHRAAIRIALESAFAQVATILISPCVRATTPPAMSCRETGTRRSGGIACRLRTSTGLRLMEKLDASVVVTARPENL